MALIRKNYHLDNKDLDELSTLNNRLNQKRSIAYHIRMAIKEYNKNLKERIEA